MRTRVSARAAKPISATRKGRAERDADRREAEGAARGKAASRKAAAPGKGRGRRIEAKEGGLDRRTEKSIARRAAILEAALDEFSARGFAAARLDDVARRAGVAKGTIYLYFKDKESLFQELVRTALSPFIAKMEAAKAVDLPLRTVIEFFAATFAREIYGTRRKEIVRLVLAEGRHFPKVAEFYYHEVIERAVAALRGLVKRAIERGEISDDALARFPQLLIAPALVAVVWEGMFNRFEKLDVEAMLQAHFRILLGALERRVP